MEKNTIRLKLRNLSEFLLSSLKWIAFGILIGMVVGLIAGGFAKCIEFVTELRMEHPWVIYFLPAAGIVIVFIYHLAGSKAVGGTNLVLSSIRKGEKVNIVLAPLIFISTVITHLFGGSAGREGAALQVGGSLSSGIAKAIRLHEKDNSIVIMCGMSAAFSALFGTPLAAAILPLEISTVGLMHYSALVPCVLSSLTARFAADILNLGSEAMILRSVPEFNVSDMALTAGFAILCSITAMLFCFLMRRSERIVAKKVPNDYIKVISAGIIIILLTLLVGDQTYNGAGGEIINACVTDPSFKIPWYGFLLKILFTVITLTGEYKGGEIVPSLFIGATFGNLFSQITGLDPALCAAIGMSCVFCGVTNCPIASMLISFELFGFDAMPFILLSIAITYLFSGKSGLYQSQVLRYSKHSLDRIDENTR